MTIPPFVLTRSLPSAAGPHRHGRLRKWALPLVVAAAIWNPAGAQVAVSIGSSPALAPGPQQELDAQFKRRLPTAPRAAIDRAEQAFLNHLRQTASMTAEQLAAGRIDDDDLSARIDVFLGDHPELSGSRPAASAEEPRKRVVEALGRNSDLARTAAERQALADRFIVWLGGLSGTARDDLLAGRMAPDELQSRINVFAADVRAERTRVVSDPAIAAVPAIADAFERENLGPVPERADSICCRGTESDGAVTREFILFKKRPGSVRIHIVQDGIVVGVLAYDGVTAWRQVPGKPPTRMLGPEAESLVSTARYDNLLVGYRERGAVARLESAPGASPMRVSIREADGSEVVETIDPATYRELSIGRRDSAGKWDETRYREYRKVGPLSVAGVQEHFSDGVLRSTTRITDVRLDTGVLSRIFSMPSNTSFDYMDFMGGLRILAQAAKKNGAGVQLPPGPSK